MFSSEFAKLGVDSGGSDDENVLLDKAEKGIYQVSVASFSVKLSDSLPCKAITAETCNFKLRRWAI